MKNLKQYLRKLFPRELISHESLKEIGFTYFVNYDHNSEWWCHGSLYGELTEETEGFVLRDYKGGAITLPMIYIYQIQDLAQSLTGKKLKKHKLTTPHHEKI